MDINIVPKTRFLSPHELTESRHADNEPTRAGLKLTQPSGSQEEQDALEKLYENLQQQLSVPRIERLAGRTLAVWDEEAQAVRVVRKDGKFGTFGYTQNGKQYLAYFEALFLLELNRLQLEYHGMLVSVEQAYILLLGEASSRKYNEYLVYSVLSRVGYILVKHRNVRYVEHCAEANEEDCVWEWLQTALHGTPMPEYVKKSPLYAKTRTKLEQIKRSVTEPETLNEKEESTTTESETHLDFSKRWQTFGKRKNDASDIQTKRICFDGNASGSRSRSLLDVLKDEPEYKKFEHIFQKFDIIRLKEYENNTETECECELSIQFDLYLHNEGFKKSTPKAPTLRVIILDSADCFPTHAEITHCYRKQLRPVPLLIVSVSESKQIQAFLYFFS